MNIIISLFLLFSFSISACDEGFFPPNSMSIPVDSLTANISENEFKTTLKEFEMFFGPGIEERDGDELIVIGSWASNTVNAFAEKKRGKLFVTMYGGMARHPALNLDGMKLVLCHELGHFFGGYPKKVRNKWSSAEGQADYYGTTKCLRRLWEREDNQRALRGKAIPQHVQNECARNWATSRDRILCQRMSMAGKSVALMIQNLDHDSIEPKFHTPDQLVVRSIDYKHPFAQCRLDTFFQGSLCPVPENMEFDDQEEDVGACHPRSGDRIGLRPHCWFVHR